MIITYNQLHPTGAKAGPASTDPQRQRWSWCHGRTLSWRRGGRWASPTHVALEDTETKPKLGAAGAAPAPWLWLATDPWAPRVEEQPGSRARMCQRNGRRDLSKKYCLQISACNKWSMCRLKYSYSKHLFFLFKIDIFLSSVNATQSFIAQELAFSDISLCLLSLRVTVLCLFFHTPHAFWHWHLKITIPATHGLTSARRNSSAKQLATRVLHIFCKKKNQNTPKTPRPRLLCHCRGRAASAPRAGVEEPCVGPMQQPRAAKGDRRWGKQPKGSGAHQGAGAAIGRDEERQPWPRGWPSFFLQAWGRNLREGGPARGRGQWESKRLFWGYVGSSRAEHLNWAYKHPTLPSMALN